MLSFKIDDDGVYNMREGDKNGELMNFTQKKTKLEEAFQKPIGKAISFKFENSGKLNITFLSISLTISFPR